MFSPAPIRGAVMDLGSNTFKFMLAEQRGDILDVHLETAFPTRLGESLAETKKIKPSSMKKAFKALKEFRKKIDSWETQRIAVIGTHALRRAANYKDFLTPAEKILNTKIHIISGKEEASLVYAGVISNPRWKKEKILDIDIGGGSVEFVCGKNGEISHLQSLSIGGVRIRDLFLSRYPLKKSSLEKAEDFLLKEMKKHLHKFLPFRGKLLSTGGTINTLCAIQSQKDEWPSLEGFRLTYSALHQIFLKLSPLSLDEIKTKFGIPDNRADIIVPGALILLSAMKVLRQKQIYCCIRALRYGIWNRRISPLPFKHINFLLLKTAKSS